MEYGNWNLNIEGLKLTGNLEVTGYEDTDPEGLRSTGNADLKFRSLESSLDGRDERKRYGKH